jgi:hypothetical protein
MATESDGEDRNHVHGSLPSSRSSNEKRVDVWALSVGHSVKVGVGGARGREERIKQMQNVMKCSKGKGTRRNTTMAAAA